MFKLTTEEKEQINKARILYYDFFNGVLVFELLEGRLEVLKQQLEILRTIFVNEDLEEEIEALQNEINKNGVQNLKEEHSRLFALPFGEKQVGIHLSHYYENCVGGESLLKARGLIKKSDIRLNREYFKEGEEHLGFLCGFMCYLLQKGDSEDLAKEVFLFAKDAFLGFCKEIKERSDAKYYRTIALLLESFMTFEVEYY